MLLQKKWAIPAVVAGLALAGAFYVLAIRAPQPVFREPVAPAQTSSPESRIDWRDCDSLIHSSRPLLCGRYFPPSAGGTLSLPFVIFRYTGADGHADPLVYLSGGPGAGMQTGDDNLQSWAYWLDELQLKRDLVIFDQKGLKPGQPYWDCDAYNQISKKLLAHDLSLADEYRDISPVLQRCLHEFDQWLRSPAVGLENGLKSINTLESATELRAMLTALKYPRWNLWGVSYGSRLALVAAQQEPARVRSLILDSPYPLDRGRPSEKPANYARALQRFWTLCENNVTACGLAVDDPQALFWRVIRQLRVAPVTYRVTDAADSSRVRVVLNDQRFFSLAHFALYDPRLYGALLKAMVWLDQAGQVGKNAGEEPADPVEFLLTLFITSAFDPEFNSLIFFATECNDNALETSESYLKAAEAQPALYPFLALEWQYSPCQLPLFAGPALLDDDPAPGAPTLILVGEQDPVTPVDWAVSLARQLPQSVLIQVAETGHAVLASGNCDHDLIRRFVESPTALVKTAPRTCGE